MRDPNYDDLNMEEIEDLPDVVLGEKTRAMRAIHEAKQNGTYSQEMEESFTKVAEEAPVVEDEIPESITDDDPGVKDELRAFFAKKEKNDLADPLPIARNELSDLDFHAEEDLSAMEQEIDEALKKEDEADNNEDSRPIPAMDQMPSVDQLLASEQISIPQANVDEPVVQEAEKTGEIDIKEVENAVAEQDSIEEENQSRPLIQPAEDPHYTLKIEPIKKNQKKRTNVMRRLVKIVLLLLVVLLGASVYGVYNSLQPVTDESEVVSFEIASGETLRTVCDNLEEEGIINNSQTAYYYIRYKKLTDLKKGYFTLDKSMSLEEIFTVLTSDASAGQDVSIATIVEGDWAKDAAKKLASVTNVTEEELLALWNDRDWIWSQRETYTFITEEMFADDVRIYLEGYLAPDTYHINAETTAEEITKIILNQTQKIYETYADDIAASGHSIAEIYTMASIIQYEAGSDPEALKNVAGVFYNRLAVDMPLQSSVTVCYAIDFDKDVDTWQACEVNPTYDNPYNTYMYGGLTPGPIENAGVNAIEAAIHPAEHDYYYFMADVYGDGTIYYARTLEEHNANVAKYLS